MKRLYKNLFVSLLIVSGLFSFSAVLATGPDLGLNAPASLGLGTATPAEIIINVIKILLTFVGIIAVLFVLYAGWLWMTSQGNPEQVSKAKKTLISAFIGLVIIIASYAIVSWILGAIIGIVSPSGGGGSGGGGGGLGGGGGSGAVSCEGALGSPSVCTIPTDSMCAPTEFCDTTSCLCTPLVGLGGPCDANLATPACDTVPNICAPGLFCSTGACICDGDPIIEWISPTDASGIPNGAPGNLITIGGRYFGTTTGSVYFWDGVDFNVLAPSPCVGAWSDNQVIVAVPGGAAIDGPIKLVRNAVLPGEDTTDNANGPFINDFDINTITRPGLCSVLPVSGYFEAPFTLTGLSLNGTARTVKFGNAVSSSTAENINSWTNTSVSAEVPNILGGNKTIFVRVDGENSNTVNFQVLIDNSTLPYISYIDTATGTPEQMITVYGGNFGHYDPAVSQISLNTGSDTYILTGAGLPAECQSNWWTDSYIIVKLPTDSVLLEALPYIYDILVTNDASFTSDPFQYEIFNDVAPPGICKIDPRNGLIGMTGVEVVGDNFNPAQGTGNVVFYDSLDAASLAFPPLTWGNQLIQNAVVPTNAQTGPLRVRNDAGRMGNSLPFTVGACSTDSECDTSIPELCCTSGYWEGICRTSCDSPILPTTGFGWSFTTEVDTTPVCGNLIIEAGEECDDGNTANGDGCSDICLVETCSGWTSGNACLLSVEGDACPNSPGECATTPAPTQLCTDGYCDGLCGAGVTCIYNAVQDKCESTNTCNATSTVVLASGTYDTACNRVGANAVWQINISASCPVGSYRDINNQCTVGTLGSPSTCNICSDGFSCISGTCFLNQDICPGSSICNASGECNTEGSCDCCCRVANSAEDCCLGLTCEAGGCGPASSVIYGLCTGCRVENDGDPTTTSAAEQLLSDDACNCSGTSGKVCTINAAHPTGACEDFIPPPPPPPPPPGTGVPGSVCEDETVQPPVCDDTFSCNADYQCMDDDPAVAPCSRCCCDPTTVPPQENASGLVCVADKSPCSGGSRGLYCGCTSDLDCGNPASVGCSTDTCCRPRPAVIVGSVNPPDNATDVCRNVQIEVPFNQKMDISSFQGNVILAKNNGSNPCPSGTNLRTFTKNDNFIGKIFALATKYISKVFAYNMTYDRNADNFCAIRGSVSGHNASSTEGSLFYKPNVALEANTEYFLIVIGDNNLNDSSVRGVRSYEGVGMGLVNTVNETFNSEPYTNSFVMSFTTLPDSGAYNNQGFCKISDLVITPSSYLAQTDVNDLRENDIDLSQDSFDTARDSDKAYFVVARTSAGQAISPIPGVYDWTWNWNITNASVATLNNVSDGAIPRGDVQNIQVIPGIKEGKTFVDVDVLATGSAADPGGEPFSADSAAFYIMDCQNPWPPVDPATGLWSPWVDQINNCMNAGSCPDMNFEIYYCRDQGSQSTSDDLPAIMSDSTLIRSGSLVSSLDLLKEYYFLREDVPSSSNLDGVAVASGNAVNIWWADDPNPALVREYSIEYGLSSGNYIFDRRSSGGHTDLASALIIDNLLNDTTYYFSVRTIYLAGGESPYSNEVEIEVKDTTPPALSPAVSIDYVGNNFIDLSWADVVDAERYNIYYKVNSSGFTCVAPATVCFAEVPQSTSGNSFRLQSLPSDQDIYFAITALDASGNESNLNVSLEQATTTLAF